MIGGLVVLAPQRFVAKRSYAMKIAHFCFSGKMLLTELYLDSFLGIGKSTGISFLQCNMRTSEYPQPEKIFLYPCKDQFFEQMLS